jgi:hypothetical protein
MLWTCPQCGAAVDASTDRCWACKQPRPEPEPGFQAESIPVPEPDRELAPAREVTATASEPALASGPLGPSFPPSEVSATESWTCAKCGEPVDAGFLVCWSCGTSIDGVEDPSFIRADEEAADGDESQVDRMIEYGRAGEIADEEALGGDESPVIRIRADNRQEPKPGLARRLCLRCQGPLESGFIADFQHSGMKPSEWVAGTPQSSFWTGTWTGDRRFPLQALRCRHCGHLEFWAGEPVDNALASLPDRIRDH